MDLYTVLKTLHVLSSTAWVGGGLVATALGFAAARKSTHEGLLDTIAQLQWCAQHVFVPASFATLAFGLGMTWLGGLWLETWVLLGLAGIALTIALGLGVLGPRIDRIIELRKTGESAEAVRLARQVLLAASFDGAILVLVVIDMVLKPALGDWPVLAGMGAVALIAALALLPRALIPSSPTFPERRP
jgi:hypothetical protein